MMSDSNKMPANPPGHPACETRGCFGSLGHPGPCANQEQEAAKPTQRVTLFGMKLYTQSGHFQVMIGQHKCQIIQRGENQWHGDWNDSAPSMDLLSAMRRMQNQCSGATADSVARQIEQKLGPILAEQHVAQQNNMRALQWVAANLSVPSG